MSHLPRFLDLSRLIKEPEDLLRLYNKPMLADCPACWGLGWLPGDPEDIKKELVEILPGWDLEVLSFSPVLCEACDGEGQIACYSPN